MDVYLKSIFEALNAEYFKGKLIMSDISWMGEESKTNFGRLELRKKIIQINPNLRSNPKALRFIVYHESVHLFLDSKEHNIEFKRIMCQYKDYQAEFLNLLKAIKDFWIEIGYLSEKELIEIREERK